MKVVLLLGLLARLASSEFSAPTAAQVTAIKNVLRTQYLNNAGYMAKAVRLGFHDCVGTKCDGCINLGNSANNGLADVITFLDSIYVGAYDTLMSRADFWQLAAIEATEFAIVRNNRQGANEAMPTSTMTFRWGREDCTDSPTTTETHVFPDPTMSRSEMMNFFSQNYGFSENEVTAVMGAHTLGGADEDSGYKGVWVVGEANLFNPNYYKLLLGDTVSYTNVAIDRPDSDGDGDRKWQWNVFDSTSGTRVGFQLNTDMELSYDIDVDKNVGTSCLPVSSDAAATTANACTEATTRSLVQTYASNGTAFWEDYKSVYDKLSSHGYTSLEQVVLS